MRTAPVSPSPPVAVNVVKENVAVLLSPGIKFSRFSGASTLGAIKRPFAVLKCPGKPFAAQPLLLS